MSMTFGCTLLVGICFTVTSVYGTNTSQAFMDLVRIVPHSNEFLQACELRNYTGCRGINVRGCNVITPDKEDVQISDDPDVEVEVEVKIDDTCVDYLSGLIWFRPYKEHIKASFKAEDTTTSFSLCITGVYGIASIREDNNGTLQPVSFPATIADFKESIHCLESQDGELKLQFFSGDLGHSEHATAHWHIRDFKETKNDNDNDNDNTHWESMEPDSKPDPHEFI